MSEESIAAYPIHLDTERRRAFTDVRTSAAPDLRFTQGDTYKLRLHGWKSAAADSAFDLYVPATLQWHTLKAAITRIDAAPMGGTWRIRAGTDEVSETTALLAFDISKSGLQTALNNLTPVAAAGGLVVVPTGAANIYRLLWNEPDSAVPLTITDNKLVPHCFSRVIPDDNTPGKVSVKIFQSPYAFTDDFTNPLPPACTVETVVSGNGTRNEVQRLRVPAGASGQFAFTTQGRGLIPVAGVTPALIADTLNAPYVAALATDKRFAARSVASGVDGQIFDIEFIGAFAKADQDLLAIEMFDQVAIETPEALLAVTGPGIEDALDGAPEVSLIFEIVAVDADGRETTLCHQACTVVNDGIDGKMASGIPAWKKPADQAQNAQMEDPNTPIISGSISWRGSLGDAEQQDETATKWNVVHTLGTLDPFVVLYSTVTRRRLKPYVEYDAEAIDEQTVRLTFPVPVGGGEISVTVVNFAAQSLLNSHEHPWTQIYKLLDDGSKQYLPDLFDALLNAMPDGWPNIPGSNIADGTMTAAKLNLADVIAALEQSPAFLEMLRRLVKDATLITNLVTEFQTNTALAQVFNSFVGAITTVFISDPQLTQLIRTIVLNVLQGGVALLPAGSTVFAIPDFELIAPPPLSAPAPSTKVNVVQAVSSQVAVGDNTTTTTGNQTVSVETPGIRPLYAELAPSLWSNDLDETTLTGRLPGTPAAAKVYTVGAGGAQSVSQTGIRRRGERFTAGERIAMVNGFWQRVSPGSSGTIWHPSETERTIWDLEVGDQYLWPGTRLSVNFVLQLALLGGARGRIYLIIESAAFTPDTNEQQVYSWQEICAERLALTEAVGYHSIRLEITRAGNGTLSGLYKLAGKRTDFAPAGANLALRARLSRFTVSSAFSNTAPARGAVSVKMNGALASIAPL